MDIKGLGSPAIKSYWWKAHKLKNPGWKQNWNEPKHKTRNEERQDKVRCWAVASAARLKLKNIYIFILTCERVLKGEKYKWQIRATGQESVWSSSWWAELHKLTELNQHIHSHCILKLHFGSPLVQFLYSYSVATSIHSSTLGSVCLKRMWNKNSWLATSESKTAKFTLQSHNGSACVTHVNMN